MCIGTSTQTYNTAISIADSVEVYSSPSSFTHIIRTYVYTYTCRTDPGNTTTSDYLVTVYLARRGVGAENNYRVVEEFPGKPVKMVFPLENKVAMYIRIMVSRFPRTLGCSGSLAQ